MAEVDLSSVTNLQSSPHTCVNCSTSETVGQAQGVNGNFVAQLNKSINDDSVQRGKDLPIDGKNLPHENISQLTGGLKSSLYHTEQNIQQSQLASNLNSDPQFNQLKQQKLDLSNTLSIDELIDPLSREIDNELLDFQQLATKQINEDDLDLLALEKGVDQSISNGLKTQELLAIETSGVEVTNDLENINQLNITQVTDIDAKQNNNYAFQSNSPVIQSVKSDIAAINQYLNLEKQFSNSNDINLSEELVGSSNYQNKSESVNLSDKLQEFYVKNHPSNNAFENLIQNKGIDVDKINNNLSFIKSDAGFTSINVPNITDSHISLNANGSYNKAIETPIPILIRQGASFEQNQQSVDQSISQNIKWLLSNKVQNANINIYPESLGQVNIALNLEESNLKISFIAATNATKELIESGISTLRAQFNESGINLQEVIVDARLASKNENQSALSDLDRHAFDQNDEVSNIDNSEIDPLLSPPNNSIKHMHLLDAYA